MANKYIVSRKITLIPVAPLNNQWQKRFDKYINLSFERVQEQIIEAQAEIDDEETKKTRKDSLSKWIDSLYKKADMYSDYISEGEITKALLNDYVYTFVRNACKAESRHKNLVISKVIDTMRINGFYDFKSDEARELYRSTFNAAVRLNNGSFSDIIDNPCGGYGLSWSNALNASLKREIINGCISCRNGQVKNFKEMSPFSIAKSAMGFSHGYDSDEIMLANMDEKNAPLYFDFGGNGTPSLLQFRMNLGANPKNKNELVSTIKRVYTGEYQYCGSSIQLSGNKIILNLTLEIPKPADRLESLRKNTVLGLSLGINTAMIGALNDSKSYFTFGTGHELEYYRKYIQESYRNLAKAVKYTNGGHGREKKLKKLEIFKARERNFVKSFNHKASRSAVDFAVKHNAGLIRMPDLSGFSSKVNDDESKYLLRNWSYYQLQQMIEDKAARVGITIEYVPIPQVEDGVADIDIARKIANN